VIREVKKELDAQYVRRPLEMRRLLILTLLLLPFFTACSGQNTTSGAQMAAANRLYEDGRFAEAAVRYQTLVDMGIQDGRLYYNLGDAYFKAGDLGRAILNFRRAQRLLPRDDDVATNLKLARAQAIDRIELESEGAIVGLVRRLIGWTTVDESALAALILWIILCALGVAAILWAPRRRLLLYLAATVATLLLLGVLAIGIRLLDERGQPPALVVASDVAVRSGPGDDYLTEFTLHAGAEVRLVERRGEWVRIVLSGDLQGWTPSQAVVEL
jgi:tetratricopeptide (TPR) repeat protein